MLNAGQTIVIKKYGNRRLYDTSASKYITLEDLAGIVQGGAEVQVVEASSGRDLTRQVLTQVVLEQQAAVDMLPIELLHAVIRAQGTLQQGPMSAFLATMTKQFLEGGNLWAKQMQQMAQLFDVGGFGATPPKASAQAEESTPPGAPAGPPADSLADMRQRMDKLLNRLNKASH